MSKQLSLVLLPQVVHAVVYQLLRIFVLRVQGKPLLGVLQRLGLPVLCHVEGISDTGVPIGVVLPFLPDGLEDFQGAGQGLLVHIVIIFTLALPVVPQDGQIAVRSPQ